MKRLSNNKASKPRRSYLLKVLVAVLLAGLCYSYLVLPTTTQALGEPNIFAVTSGNVLIRFNSATPGNVTTIGAITTAPVAGDTIVAIDIRPGTGQLFGLGAASRLYTINPLTAAATQVGVDGQFTLPPGQSFGFDFNPTVDRIRVTSDSQQNFRLNPNNGTRPGAVDDTTLTYPTAVGNFDAGGAAYTNNFSGATVTTLYDIDTAQNTLVLQGGPNGAPSPNGGVLTTVGSLGINPTDDLTRANTAFDILTTGTPAAPVNTGFASLTLNGTSSGFYTIDLSTGAATLVGAIGAAPTLIRGIAVEPQITPPGTAYAIDAATNNLVRFNVGNPGTIISSIPITGLVGGDTMLGLDVRPATGELFGHSSGSRLYVINPVTGAAVQRGSDGGFATVGVGTGFDFNPIADRVRFVTDSEHNFRINPDVGNQVDGDTFTAGVQRDTDLAYAAGDPNDGANPDAAGAAYTNNFLGATTTTIYDIDTAQNILVMQGGLNVPPGTPSPNGGQLFTVGPLGLDPTSNSHLGFDIQTLSDGTNLAFAAITTNGTTSALYSINLITGAATQIGATPIGGAAPLLIRGLTLAPMGDIELSAPTYSVGESGPVATITVNRLRGSEGTVSAIFSTSNGTATAPADYTDSDQLVSFGPGQTSTTVTIPLFNDGLNEGNQTVNLALSAPAGGARLGAQSTAVLTITDDDTLQNANAYGVTLGANLVRFNTATPGTIISSIFISGLQPGEFVLGIDTRPATGQLYALGSTSRLYIINPNTGVATQVGTGTFDIALSVSSAFGFDFDPTVDRIRVTSGEDQNLRLDPNTGAVVDFNTGAPGTQADDNLIYDNTTGDGDPIDPNVGSDPIVAGSAYTNSVNGATSTTLYDIDMNLDILVIQNPQNNGVLNTVGPLGVDVSNLLGFDIRGADTAFASMVVGGTPTLYGINLTTGAATPLGTIGPGGGTILRAFALATEGFGNTTLVGTTATFGGSSTCEALVFDQAGGLLRHNRFSSGDPGFASDFDFDAVAPGDQTLSASNAAINIIVNAGPCDDQISIGSASAPASGLAASFQINGQGGGDSLIIDDAASATARTITINGTTSTITGLGGPISYGTLERATVNAGTGGDTINIQGSQVAMTSVFAGGGDDVVVFGNGARLFTGIAGGLLDGGGGNNTLDYSAYTTPLSVNLDEQSVLFLATLSGAQEPGPLSNSPAVGGLHGVLADGASLGFNIIFQNLTGASVTGTHFHNAPAGVNGPIVRALTAAEQIDITPPDGFLSGEWLSTDPAGIGGVGSSGPLTPALVTELLANRIYFNIHTNVSPSGEIRGQLINQGMVGLSTGTAGIRSFNNVTGGSQNDLLLGNTSANVLRGGPGNDTIVGRPGGDQLFGDAGDDTLTWINGDGSDFMEGGADNDTVRVNGSDADGDQFLIQVNPADPARLRFDRTNLGLFNLNIGTTEALVFSTLGGNDTTTVEYAGGNPIPAGIAGGPGLEYFGGSGGGDLLVLQRSAGSFSAPAETYTATGAGAGDITLAGSLIRFSQLAPEPNLAPINDTIPVTNFTFTAPPASPALNIVNGPAIGTTQINDLGASSFPPFNFANKANVTANSGTVSQLINVNNPTPALGLLSLTVNGNAGSDIFNVKALATVVINVNGSTPVTAPGDVLNYDTEGRTVSGDTTPPDGTINSPGVQPVNFTGIEGVNLANVPISINDVTVTEGDAGAINAVFTVSLPLATSQTVTVDYVTSNGNASAPGDYAAVTGTLTFAPGVASRTITVPVNGDTVPEPTETFSVDLSNPSNGTIGDGHGVGTINDNDASGNFQFTAASATVAESANTIAIGITRTGSTSVPASVRYETSDITAQQKGDYTFAFGVVQFAVGETSKTVNISLINDVLVEGNESFQVTLSNPSGAFVIGNPSPEIIIITDDDLVPSAVNPIDDTNFFVRLHYLDFLGREPDVAGFNFWTNNIDSCGADANCREVRRIDTSASFFLSIEFQETGGNAIRTRRVAFGQLSADPGSRVSYLDFMRATRQIGEGVIVGQPGFEAKLEQNKQAYAQQIEASPDFLARFPISSGAAYVDALSASAGIVPTTAERTAAINAFGAGGTAGRVAALRSITDSSTLRLAEFSPSFVLAQYFGYLRRSPTDAPDFNDAGYQFWLSKLNLFNGDFHKAEMVKAFITSLEYRNRVGP